MRASRLRESVVLQRWDGSAWVDQATIYAEVTNVGSTDGGTSQQYQVATHRTATTLAVLPAKELQSTHRFIWNSETLDIFNATDLGPRSGEIQFDCKKLLPAS